LRRWFPREMNSIPNRQPAVKLVCLVGFMGSGKSTTARLLARQVGWTHVDLDKHIIEITGLSIPAIFARAGEPGFRKIEHEGLARLIGEAVETRRPRIISLGGGTTAQPQNVTLLRQNGAILIWLHCAVEELLRRCARITNRPLFKDEASFRRLYEERLPAYVLADHRVESHIEPLRVVEQILALGIFPKLTIT